MQFLVFILPGVYQKKVDANFKPDIKKMEEMGRFNDDVQKTIKVLGLNGLQPLANGARISYSGGKATVTDGPFVEAKEIVGGYWMIEAKSKEEVVNLWKRCPVETGDVIEIRPIFDLTDLLKDAAVKS